MLLSLEDSKETLLADEGEVRGLDWTPDGTSVIYSSNRAGQFALWRLPISGGEPHRIQINDQWVTEPSLARSDDEVMMVEWPQGGLGNSTPSRSVAKNAR